MGPARKALTSRDVTNKTQPALCAFPSPASLSDSLSSPGLFDSIHYDPCSCPVHLTPRDDPLEVAHIVPSEPDDIRLESVMTPPTSESNEPNMTMNTLVGGALAPTHSIPPPRQPTRLQPGLRLPSFEALGIAAPHPDRFGGLDGTLSNAAREAMQNSLSVRRGGSELMMALKAAKIDPSLQNVFSNPVNNKTAGRVIHAPLHHYVDTLTPPAEAGYPNWNSMARITTAMDSPATEPGSGALDTDKTPIASETVASGTASNEAPEDAGDDEPRSWIKGAIDVLVNLRTTPAGMNSLKMLSHALPSPSPTGHIFSEVIAAVHTSVTSPMTWINVFHAIPGRFNLQDLPRSPPTTPGPAIGGEDYFTEKVFDSAVSVADYQEDLSQLPRSPRPVVPPSSVDVSIVERYIPPSTSNEFAEMFNPEGPSILVDRLVELSPNNGSLLFIYPTKAGAETFMQEYLGPILDPALRSMSVTQGFPTELNRTLGNMVAAHVLPSYETVHRRVAALCARLTQRASAAERFHGRRPNLALSYSSKQYVRLTREAWAHDWWLKQEKSRVRDIIAKYAREAQTRPSNEHVDRPKTGTELLKDLFDDFERRARSLDQELEQGIEVSVFVITRTS